MILGYVANRACSRSDGSCMIAHPRPYAPHAQTVKMAWNHTVRGILVESKMVPAVMEARQWRLYREIFGVI